MGGQLLTKQLVVLSGKPLFRREGQNALVSVFNHKALDQSLKIVGVRLLAQASVGIPRFDMDEGLRIVIQPAVHHLQAVHQSGGPGAEIRLPVPELIIIQSGLQRLFINALPRDAGKLRFDRPDKFFPVGKVRVLRDDAEIGLAQAVFIIAVNVLTDPFVQKGLL